MPFRRMVVRAAVVAVLVLSPALLSAQAQDAQVLDPGMIGFRVAGQLSLYTERFGDPLMGGTDGRQALGELFVASVSDLNFAPLLPLRGGLNRVFHAVLGDSIAEPGTLLLETERLRVGADHRVVPFELEVGVLPRVALRASLPLVQHTLTVTGLVIGSGTVGWNPDPAFNRGLLGSVDTAFAALGGGQFLPTADSELGQRLQEVVRARAGGAELRLPSGPPAEAGTGGIAGTEAITAGRYAPGLLAWELGDLEAGLSVQLVDRSAPAGGPPAAGLSGRVALDVGVRVPTGTATDGGYLVFPRPVQGQGGLSAGLRAELGSARYGAFGGVRLDRVQGQTLAQRIWPAAELEPGELHGPAEWMTVRWEPGTRMALQVQPFVQLVDELRVGLGYGLSRRAGQSYTVTVTAPDGTPVTADAVTSAETAHSWGLAVGYSTVDAYRAGRTGIPFEARVLVGGTVTGSGGAPARRFAELQGRLFLRLWGG